MRWLLIARLSAFVAILSACSPAVTEKNDTTIGTAATSGGDRVAGKQIYVSNCATCHGATGLEGGVVGPSLRNEASRMEFSATVSWIEDPQPPMPKLYPKMLTKAQVRDVAAYVQSL